ncbi:MAG: type II secretion system F family protein [Myxococcota bacterium]|nr:type II secretion system F family protein [Myxococcota bacterium]
MLTFMYEAKNRTGAVVKGTLTAETEDAAQQRLKGMGLTVSTIRNTGKDLNFNFLQRKGVSTKDLKTFSRQFATMIDSGLPLVQCLEILGGQSDNKYFGKCVLEIKSHVEGGSTFSEALAKYPRIFDELFVALVAAGEVGGILDTIMKRLADYIEKREQLERRIKGAMVYPVAILVITVVVVTVMLQKVIPTFVEMFESFGAADALPGPTKFVVGLSEAFQSHFISIMITLFAIPIGLKLALRQPKVRAVMHRLYLVLPIVGPVIRKIAVARFTRTLGTLLSSGVPILDALMTVSKAAGNVVIERAILFARNRISEGRNMSEPLADAKVFPGMVVQMIAVGEQTGALDVMCNKIADFYDEEVDVAVAALTSLLEPLMMVVIGGIVGGMVIAMYLPVFNMAGAIKAE